MPISRSNHLYNLIKSLNKAEKRNFKLYVNRLNSNEHVKFLHLFDIIDKSSEYDEKQVKKKFKNTTNNQFSNLKRHLYSQILTSLRLIHNKNEIDLQLRELLDYAKILYTKGLYLQSLKILDKAKKSAKRSNQDYLLMEILEFEKLIESRHITRSRKIKNKVEKLIDESNHVKRIIENACDLANLNLKIHGLYIKMGHVKSELELFIAKDYFYSNLPSFDWHKLSFFEKIYLHQSYVWYNYTIMNFTFCYKHARNWVHLFQTKSHMIEKDPDLYMRGFHYLLTCLFNLRHFKRYIEFFHSFERFHRDYSPHFNMTSQLIYFIYGFNAKLNYYFLKGEYIEAKKLIPRILQNIEMFKLTLDQHRKIIFYYKIAWLHFALAEYEEAIDYLNEIYNLKKEQLRSDILCYSRLMTLLLHFELGNLTLVVNLLPSVQRNFKQNKENNPAHDEVFSFLKKAPQKRAIKPELFEDMGKKFTKYYQHSYHKRAFLYFDFLAWINAKIKCTTIAEIIQAQYRESKKSVL